MKLVCSKLNLLNGVRIVSKAIPGKTTMSILQCILINASDTIKLTANDMELGIETIVEGDIVEPGIVALDAKLFLNIVNSFKNNDDIIEIETDGTFQTVIKSGNTVMKIVGKSGEDFSYLPSIEKLDSIVLSQFTLREIIYQTIFSISDNEANKVITGELFEVNEDKLRVASSDGHRISVRKVYLKNSYPKKKVIVPGKALNEISKILSNDTDKDVVIFFTNKHIVFEFDNTTVVSRLIEGDYFSIDQMLSSDYETKVTINKMKLLDIIERAMVLVKEGDKKPIIMDIIENTMELKLRSTFGSIDDSIDIAKSGKDLMIGFNPKFFIDALRVIDEENVDIYLVNPKAPCFIKDSEESYVYMILPVNFTTVS